MSENRNTSKTNATEFIEVETYEITDKKVRSSKIKKAVKGIAALCCAAVISVGSIAGYRYVNENDAAAFQMPSAVKTEKNEDRDVNSEFSKFSLANVAKNDKVLDVQDVYTKVLPSVVGITSDFAYTSQNAGYSGFFGYGGGMNSTPETVTGTGTGIIMSDDGYIITNAHVIYSSEYGGKAASVKVRLYDETEYDADIIGYDTQTDVAVIKVKDAPVLTAAEFGDSSSLRVGDSAYAIGNPLGFDLFGTLTVGYISGLNREMAMDDTIMHLIQTDAAINSGNSGGPLVNNRGEVIGINSMKLSNTYSSSEASIEGLGFAIPMNEAREIVSDLMEYGYVAGRPGFGMTCSNVTASQYSPVSGVYVNEVNENGAADRAGIKQGDVIVGINGEAVTDIDSLNRIKNQFSAGDTVKITVIRNNRYSEFDVTLEAMKQNS